MPLLEATSKVANISRTYGAYLKHWDGRTYKDLTLVPVYIDPPYNARQYITNYNCHLLETIARYDNPHIRGKTGLRDYDAMEKSAYCANTNCLGAFRSLIEKADAKHILVSYNNEGLLSQDEIMSVLLLRGAPCSNTSIDYRWFKSNSRRETPATANGVRELLFYVKVVTAPKKNQPQPAPKRRYDPRNKLNNLSDSEWTYFLKSVELEGDDHNVGKLNDLSEAEWTVALAPVWDTHYPTKGPESYGHRIRK